jgi:5'-nucleotidase
LSNDLAAGAGGFTVLEQGTNRLVGDVDVDAFVAYVKTHSPSPDAARNSRPH